MIHVEVLHQLRRPKKPLVAELALRVPFDGWICIRISELFVQSQVLNSVATLLAQETTVALRTNHAHCPSMLASEMLFQPLDAGECAGITVDRACVLKEPIGVRLRARKEAKSFMHRIPRARSAQLFPWHANLFWSSDDDL
jgi:hypothetical protein